MQTATPRRARTASRATLPPFPTGWYAVLASVELRPGHVHTTTFFGREIVVWRAVSGAVHAAEAFCPHLGAHLGKGGRVVGETLRCPFHGFRFDGTGACVHAYGEGTIKKALKTLPCVDRNGWILVWGDTAGRAPTFEIPPIELDGWTPLQRYQWELDSHPQETTENSVDVGHFTEVHGYTSVGTVSPMVADGPYLTATYTMLRENPLSAGLPQIRSTFQVHVWGLGYSQVDIAVQGLGIHSRLFVLPQATDGTGIVLRIGTSTRHLAASLPGPLNKLPTGFLSSLINRTVGDGAASDVADDFEIWNHKAYLSPPALARGDGPIGQYRRYCRQFYPES
jgi:nitrite reductase/ring-hydroxylating ferredoxin subunit